MTETAEKVTRKGNVVKIKVLEGYTIPKESMLCKATDTGNGYVFKFPSYSSVRQTNYICMDYAEADMVWKALSKFFEKQYEQ